MQELEDDDEGHMQNLCDICFTFDLAHFSYRVAHLLTNLGWVDFDLGSSPGWWPLLKLPTAQAGWWNIPNQSQPNPCSPREGPPRISVTFMKGPSKKLTCVKYFTHIKKGSVNSQPRTTMTKILTRNLTRTETPFVHIEVFSRNHHQLPICRYQLNCRV